MRTEHDLIALAHEAHSLEALRQGALALLTEAFDAQVGIFATLDVPREKPTLLGLEPEGTRLEERWEQSGRELIPVKAAALREGVASDREVLGARLEATQHYREVMAPRGGTETLFLVPQFRGRPLGLLALGREARLAGHALVEPALDLGL